MTVRERPGPPGGAALRGLGDRDIDGVLYTADMYGLPVDLLADVLGGSVPQGAARGGRIGPAHSRAGLGVADPGRAGRLRAALRGAAPHAAQAGAHPGHGRGAAGPGGHSRVPAGGRVLAERTAA